MHFISEEVPNTKSEKFTIQFESGLAISTVFNGHVKEEARNRYKEIWKYISKYEDKIQFLNEINTTVIYLLPTNYWEIYKKLPGGKTFMSYSYYDEKEKRHYEFPAAKDYFSNKFSPLDGGNGVYGIYDKDELIYIGYTTNGFYNRYDQHRECFKEHKGTNSMYYAHKLDDIEFKELITEKDIQDIFHTEAPIDSEIFQLIEYSLIRVLQPKENREGITSAYILNRHSIRKRLLSQSDKRVSIIQAIQSWLLDETVCIDGEWIKPEEVWVDSE